MRQIWNTRKTRSFRTRLLRWYGQHRRELPWRTDPTPYRVWVSEIMLQQTQVRTVLPFFQRFVARFPNVESLAAASEDEVVGLWAGLGYYSRARNLHAAARVIVEDHCGQFPDTLESVLSLPGVGRYTAGAILSIAFNRRAPVVDGNVRRVVARLHAIREEVPEDFCWHQAEAWVDEERPSDFNQALMELGALVCTPAAPLCLRCPVGRLCEARARGVQGEIPASRQARRELAVEIVVLWLECDGSVVVVPNQIGFVPGKVGLPSAVSKNGETAYMTASRLARRMGCRPSELRRSGLVRHAITYRRIRAHVYTGRIPRRGTLRLAAPRSLASLLTSSLYRKAATLAADRIDRPPERR